MEGITESGRGKNLGAGAEGKEPAKEVTRARGRQSERNGAVGVGDDGLVVGPMALAHEGRVLGREADRGRDGVVEGEVEGGCEQGLSIEVLGVGKDGIEELRALDPIHGQDADDVVLRKTDEEIEAAAVLEELQWIDLVGLGRRASTEGIGDVEGAELFEAIEDGVKDGVVARVGLVAIGRAGKERGKRHGGTAARGGRGGGREERGELRLQRCKVVLDLAVREDRVASEQEVEDKGFARGERHLGHGEVRELADEGFEEEVAGLAAEAFALVGDGEAEIG